MDQRRCRPILTRVKHMCSFWVIAFWGVSWLAGAGLGTWSGQAGPEASGAVRTMAAATSEKTSGNSVGEARIDLKLDAGLLELRFRGQRLLTYAFASNQFKPYVRALFSLAGDNVLRDAPPDHLHHHGLMYAMRVNGVNFWEETGQPGYQRPLEELSHRTGLDPSGLPGATFSQLLGWVTQKDHAAPDPASVALLLERRTLTVTVDERLGEVAVVWQGDFALGKGVTQVTLAGSNYNGLGLRLPAAFDHGARFQNSEGRPYSGPGRQDVMPARWGSVTGSIQGREITVGLLARPAETKGVTKFFTMLDPFAYLAVTQGLDQTPLEYSAGDKFSVRYLLVVYSAARTPEFLRERQERWEKSGR